MRSITLLRHPLPAAVLCFVIGQVQAALVADEAPTRATPDSRPNILWLVGEDMGPDLGCYGNALVTTPQIDALAAAGVRFTQCFTTAPVCSPSRSAVMTGMYQTSIGAHHHRSHRDDGYRLPSTIRTITDQFRAAGYFTANLTDLGDGLRGTGKTDFNFAVEHPYDGTDWRQAAPGQPFFAVMNFDAAHRGPAWYEARKLSRRVDPRQVKLPAYYADHPFVREDYANYLDAVSLLDQKIGKVLDRLRDDGLADRTIVFFFADNGQCLFRGKQWLYDGGIHIPLVIRWPPKLRPGGAADAGATPPPVVKPGETRDQLVSAIDITATTLWAAGIKPFEAMQGQTFLGPRARPRQFIFAARDRCDETADRIRCVRSERWKYIRNFERQRPYDQPNRYKDRTYPALAVMRELSRRGELTPAASLFFARRRPAEELYDLRRDPDEVHNLADDPAQRMVLETLRGELDRWIVETDDQGRIPEREAP